MFDDNRPTLPLDLSSSAEEARAKVHQWSARARSVASPEAQVLSWRHPVKGNVYLFVTQSRELARLRDGGPILSPELHRHHEAVALRKLDFQKTTWRNEPALVSTDRVYRKPYAEGEAFDPQEWDLVPDAWDHEHCQLCFGHICSHTDCGVSDAYLCEEPDIWVCPSCYDQYVAGWELLAPDHAVLGS